MILGRHKSSPPTNLAEWLAVATRDLVPSAQARIRTEIESHYAEAVQAHLGKGSNEAAAQTAALTDLGDAQASADRFSRQYPTTQDTKSVASDASGEIAMGLMWLACFISTLYPTYYPGPLGVLLILSAGFFTYLFIHILVRWKTKAVNRRQTILVSCLAWLNAVFFCVKFNNHFLPTDIPEKPILQDGLIAMAGLLIILGALLTYAIIYRLIWRKAKVDNRVKIIVLTWLVWLAGGYFYIKIYNGLMSMDSPHILFNLALPVCFIFMAMQKSISGFRLHKKMTAASEGGLPPRGSAAA